MKVELIAELATNFGSSIPLGKEFIRKFAEAGVDTVKVQVFNHWHMRPTDPQYEWFLACQLHIFDYRSLKQTCDRLGVGFLATGYHPNDVSLIAGLTDRYRIKIGSGEAHDKTMAAAVRLYGFQKVLVSTGLTAVEESPFSGLRYWGRNVKFLGCVTRYPAPPGIAYTMMQSGKYAGWSDHSEGLNECKAAIVGGAKIVEFHVQLPNQARPARSYEKTVEEVRELRAFADEDPAGRFVGRWSA
jgi:N,N'-diacetyllegionaminate synthase